MHAYWRRIDRSVHQHEPAGTPRMTRVWIEGGRLADQIARPSLRET